MKIILKGEAEGHPFRGNQWTDGRKLLHMVDAINASSSVKNKVRKNLELGLRSFDNHKLNNTELDLIDRYVMGDVGISGRGLVGVVSKCTVLHPVTVYRATANKQLKKDSCTSFSLRKDWVENYAKDNDLQVHTLDLKVGDSALFVPFYNSRHIVEVEVLVMVKS